MRIAMMRRMRRKRKRMRTREGAQSSVSPVSCGTSVSTMAYISNDDPLEPFDHLDIGRSCVPRWWSDGRLSHPGFAQDHRHLFGRARSFDIHRLSSVSQWTDLQPHRP